MDSMSTLDCQPASPGCLCGTWWIWDSGAQSYVEIPASKMLFFVDVCLLEVTSFLQANVQAWLASWRYFLEVLDNYVGTHGLCSERCELRLSCELMEGPSWKLINHHVRVAWTNPHHFCCVQLVKCCRNKQTRSQTSQSKNVQRCSGCLTPQRSWNHYSSINNNS